MLPKNPAKSAGDNAITDQYIFCNVCTNGLVLISDNRKTCGTCREKRRLLRVEKKRKAGLTDEAPQPDRKRRVIVPDAASEPGRPSLANMPTQERGDVSQMVGKMSDDIKRMLIDGVREHQTASDMYEALRVRAVSERITFAGTFSIVADPNIDNKSRVGIAAREVSKVIRTPLSLLEKWKDLFAPHGYTAVFSCSCTAYSTPNNPDPTRSLGVSCNGKVAIKVLDDTSHDLSIPGQKVIVSIRHT